MLRSIVTILVTTTALLCPLTALTAAEPPAPALVPSLDPFMLQQHYAPRWAVGADGATIYVFTPGGPQLPDRYGDPLQLVVAFPPIAQSPLHNPLQILLNGAPMAWLALLFNGGQDLASATDAELYAQRFGWDTTQAGLISRIMLPVPRADRRAALERLLAVRLLQDRSTPAARAALASLSDPTDADLTAALSPTPAVMPDPIPWIATLPLHGSCVAVWQPECCPALPDGMTAMRTLNALRDIDCAARGVFHSSGALVRSCRMTDGCCLLPFEFARTFGNCTVTRAVMSCDLTFADLISTSGPPLATSFAVEGQGLQAISRIAQAYGVSGIPDQTGVAGSAWQLTATDRTLRATYRQAPSGILPEGASWGRLGLDAKAMLWVRFSSAVFAGMGPNPFLSMLALGPDEDLVARIGMEDGNTVVSLSAPAHGAAAMQALSAWSAAMLQAAHQQVPTSAGMLNRAELLDLLRIPQASVVTTGDRCVISWILPGALLQDELPFSPAVCLQLAPTWPAAAAALLTMFRTPAGTPGLPAP